MGDMGDMHLWQANGRKGLAGVPGLSLGQLVLSWSQSGPAPGAEHTVQCSAVSQSVSATASTGT